MSNEKMILASQTVELSEHSKYLELETLMCFYDAPNDNMVELQSKDALEKAKTLINMPVVAKYKVKSGEPDLGGHEAYIDRYTKEVKFNTDNIGTHIDVYIKETEVEINGEKQTLPCLYSTSRIWTRNKNVVKAIKRLYEEGKLTSSWEISVNSYIYKDGIKILDDYCFEANCLLGSDVTPAYPCASVVDMSSLNESQLMIAQALEQDKEVSMAEEVSKNEIETTPVVKTETSTLTPRDIEKHIYEELQNKYDGYIAMLIVDENYCLFKEYGSDALEFIMIPYSVENENVIVDEGKQIKLIVPVSETNSAISTRDQKIMEDSETIKSLKSTVASLEPYKAQVDRIEAEKVKAENERKMNELKDLATKSGFITSEELESDESIKKMIASLDRASINNLIVERMMNAKNDDITPTTSVSTVGHIDISSEEESSNVSFFEAYMNLN
jgi:hypothetical protein